MLSFLFFITTINCRSQNKIKLQNHNDMMKYLYNQDSDYNLSNKPYLYNDLNIKYYCVGTKLNRCQYVSQSNIQSYEQIIKESDINKIIKSATTLVTFYITASVQINLNVLLLKDKNISFYADPAVNSTIFLVDTDNIQEEPPSENIPEEPPSEEPSEEPSEPSESTGETDTEESVPTESNTEESITDETPTSDSSNNEPAKVLSNEDIQIPQDTTEIFIDKIVFHGVSLSSNFSDDIIFYISELVLDDAALLDRINNNGILIIDKLITDFSTIISSEGHSQSFFQKIQNLTVNGENSMTTIHFQENYTFQISNVGTFLDQAYQVYHGTLPKADYLYFITDRRLDLEADYQMPVLQPHYNKSGVFLSSNYPYIQFSQSNKGLWTEEAQTSIDIFMYEGRRLTLSGNFNKMNTTYYQLNDVWEDSLNLYELNDRALVPIVGSCVATVFVFFFLYCLTVGRTIRKYRKLENSKNIKSINVDARPVVDEKTKKRDQKKQKHRK